MHWCWFVLMFVRKFHCLDENILPTPIQSALECVVAGNFDFDLILFCVNMDIELSETRPLFDGRPEGDAAATGLRLADVQAQFSNMPCICLVV